MGLFVTNGKIARKLEQIDKEIKSLKGFSGFLNQTSIISRQSELYDSERMLLATRLLDHYKGHYQKYVESLIERTFKLPRTQARLVNNLTPVNIFKKLVNNQSKIYARKPKRCFYLNGKEIVKENPNPEIIDNADLEINKDLYERLHNIYDLRLQTELKQAEKNVNIFGDCIYKVIYSMDKVCIKFLPNDLVTVEQDIIDETIAKTIHLHSVREKKDFRNRVTGVEMVKSFTYSQERTIYELAGEKQEDDNKYFEEAKRHLNTDKEAIIGSAFAPFVVLRNDLPQCSFWSSANLDTVVAIEKINELLAQLNYLIAYQSMPLFYAIGLDIPNQIQPDTVIEFAYKNNKGVPPMNGESSNAEVGVLDPKSKLIDILDVIKTQLKFIFNSYSLSFDDLIMNNQIKSAESKQFDNKELNDIIESRRDIWTLNEQDLFTIIQIVYNTNNPTNRLPEGLSLAIDYQEEQTEFKDNDSWIVEIQNNVSSLEDWILSNNPNLTLEQAMKKKLANIKSNTANMNMDFDINLPRGENAIDSDSDNIDN